MDPILQVKGISKTFPGVKALTDISIDFYPGEVHALLGENGAGKSTLIKIISGVYTPTEGKVYLDGKECDFNSPRKALDAGIAVIHQELSIANDLTVAENIYLGAEPTKGGAHSIRLDRKKMESDAQNVLDSMKVDIKANALARDLSTAQQQMVEIARIITKNARVVIMDEPTSSLSDHEIDSLFNQIRVLKSKNVAIIYISHRLKELFMICDKVTVLRDGCFVTTVNVKDVTEKHLVGFMVGREMKDYYNREVHTRGKEMLRVEHLSSPGVFKDVSFTAYAGEILGFSGLIGAGRTEVMETIFGARKASEGKVFVEGKEVSFTEPKEAIDAKIGMVTEDRRRTGLMLNSKLSWNLVLPSLPKHQRTGNRINPQWEKEVSEKIVSELEVKTPSIETIVANLSGGNQQKIVLGKWLIADSRIMILDEPTRGIDVNAKSEFYHLMNQFVAKGGCIVMVSSELPEVLGISDRIIVMHEGKVTGELSYQEATEQKIMELASLTVANWEK
jgi:ABC-type sugar transport system ATPase subunit